MNYTKILLSIIFSPIILIFEAFPDKGTFSYWIKGLFVNLLTFPVVAILLLTSGMIANISSTGSVYLDGSTQNSSANQLWRPPFLYSIEAEGFIMLIAISIIFLIPDIIAYIKKTFGVEDLPFSISPGKLLSGAGIATAGATGLFFRARSLANEFGLTKERIAADSRWSFLKPILPESQYSGIAKAINARTNAENQVQTPS